MMQSCAIIKTKTFPTKCKIGSSVYIFTWCQMEWTRLCRSGNVWTLYTNCIFLTLFSPHILLWKQRPAFCHSIHHPHIYLTALISFWAQFSPLICHLPPWNVVSHNLLAAYSAPWLTKLHCIEYGLINDHKITHTHIFRKRRSKDLQNHFKVITASPYPHT